MRYKREDNPKGKGKMRGVIAVIFMFFTVALLVPALVFAAGEVKGPAARPIPCVPSLPCVQVETQTSPEAVREYVQNTFGVKLLQWFLGIVATASVVFIIIGGVQLHIAVGNEDGIGNAKKTLTWAFAGLVIALLSYYIVAIISGLPL